MSYLKALSQRIPFNTPLRGTQSSQRVPRNGKLSVSSVNSVTKVFVFSMAAAVLSACTVGPKYQKPTVETPAAYRSLEGWKTAKPSDDAPRGQWWAVFRDPVLNELAAKVEINNQNLRLAEANYRRAQALVAQARAAIFPSVNATTGVTRADKIGRAHV